MHSDSAYPSTTWQVMPYNFNVNFTESQKAFNMIIGHDNFRECRDAEVLREILTVYVSNNM